MKNFLLLAICFLTVHAFLFGQSNVTEQGASAPIKWERYRDKDQNISFLFPKMPTAQTSNGGCSEVNTDSYYAFAEGVVYSLTVYSKLHIQYPCTRMVEFDRKLLLDRLAKLHGTTADDPDVVAAAQDGQKTRFNNDRGSIWVFPQMAKNRWIEMAIVGRKDAKTNEKEFVESLELKSNEGEPIGDGSEATLGDSDPGAPDAPATDPAAKPAGDPLMIIAKPRAKYTEYARHANEQGTVKLRVELLRNGAVGKIEALSTLKYGLTEQAIAAAKKIAFLPRQVNGVRVNSVVTFEYSFSIY
jgi:TonB family protein